MTEASTEVTPGQILDLRTEQLAYGGTAIARHEGRAVFVAFAAPDERVRAEVTRVDDPDVYYDIDVASDDGELLMEIRGLHLRRITEGE